MAKKLILIAMLSTLTAPSMAEGFYLLGSVGQSRLAASSTDMGGQPQTGSTVSFDNTDMAYKLQLGYQFNPYFAVEGGYVNLGEAKYQEKNTNLNYREDANWKVDGFNIAAVGIFPINDQFSVLGKLGAISASAKWNYSVNNGGTPQSSSDSSTNLKTTWGVGVSWNVMRQLAVRAEFEQFRKLGDGAIKKNVNLMSVGVAYKF